VCHGDFPRGRSPEPQILRESLWPSYGEIHIYIFSNERPSNIFKVRKVEHVVVLLPHEKYLHMPYVLFLF
jgi:hypothetical protein